MDNLLSLLNKVSNKVQAFETAQSLYGQQLAPKFNTFDYILTNELGLSRILADLLNPKGSHAQKHHFLELFIKHCLPSNIKNPNWQHLLENLDKAQVTLEELTHKSDSLRRMDIYISYIENGISYGICIENKPYATDQLNQLKDYAQELIYRHEHNWHIIYLSEYRDAPSEHSVNKDSLTEWKNKSQFSVLKYSSLIEWLKLCQLVCQNYRVTEFLEQFIKFIQQQFMGIENMNETNAIVDVMKQNVDTIEASFKVSNALELMKQQLIEKLKYDLKEAFTQNVEYTKYLEIDLDNIGEGHNFEQINLKIKNYDKAYISFEFQSPNYNRPYIGIKFISLDEAKVCPYSVSVKMREILNKKLSNRQIGVSDLWPAGYWFIYEDWKDSSEPWQMIENNKMASLILREMHDVYKALEENGCFGSY